MKKFARVLALMLIATMLCLTLVACAGKPNEDPKAAKDALKDADYNVRLDDDEEDLAWYDYDGLKAYLYATKFDPEIDDEDDLEDMDGETITADCIKVYYFEDEDAAKEAFEELEDELNEWLEDMEDELQEIADEAEEEFDVEIEFDFDPVEATLDGCMIYVGTSGALKDAA